MNILYDVREACKAMKPDFILLYSTAVTKVGSSNFSTLKANKLEQSANILFYSAPPAVMDISKAEMLGHLSSFAEYKPAIYLIENIFSIWKEVQPSVNNQMFWKSTFIRKGRSNLWMSRWREKAAGFLSSVHNESENDKLLGNRWESMGVKWIQKPTRNGINCWRAAVKQNGLKQDCVEGGL